MRNRDKKYSAFSLRLPVFPGSTSLLHSQILALLLHGNEEVCLFKLYFQIDFKKLLLFVRKAGFSWQTCAVSPQQKHELKNLWSRNFQRVKMGSWSETNLSISENNSKYDLENMLMLVGARFGWQCFLVPSFMVCDSKPNTNETRVGASRRALNTCSILKQTWSAPKQVQYSAALCVNATLVFNGISWSSLHEQEC